MLNPRPAFACSFPQDPRSSLLPQLSLLLTLLHVALRVGRVAPLGTETHSSQGHRLLICRPSLNLTFSLNTFYFKPAL